MEAERDRGAEEDMKQQQDRRLKPMQSENHQQPPQQPQKCPRCESLNTKFCYYNNYSLSQPRYFCKTCRRYWTQGGTLRNVPVGGGCRKGKRTKASSSGDNSRSQPSPPQQQFQVPQNLSTISTNSGIPTSPVLRNKEPGNSASPSAIPPMTSYYPGAGFLSSLAAIQSLNQPQPFNQPLNVGGDFGGGSNLALLQGFNVPSFSSQHQQLQQQTEFFQMGNRDKNIEPLYPSDESLTQPSRPISSHHNWHQSFINNTNPTASDASYWSISSTSNNNPNSNTAGSSMNPNQWPDLPGYGPPP